MPTLGVTFALLCAWAVCVGFVGAFVDIAIPTIIQLKSGEDRVGSNFSFFNTVANTADAVSGPLVGGLAAGLALGLVIVAAGGCVVLVAAAGTALARTRGCAGAPRDGAVAARPARRGRARGRLRGG